jgi:hypothetical protein
MSYSVMACDFPLWGKMASCGQMVSGLTNQGKQSSPVLEVTRYTIRQPSVAELACDFPLIVCYGFVGFALVCPDEQSSPLGFGLWGWQSSLSACRFAPPGDRPWRFAPPKGMKTSTGRLPIGRLTPSGPTCERCSHRLTTEARRP